MLTFEVKRALFETRVRAVLLAPLLHDFTQLRNLEDRHVAVVLEALRTFDKAEVFGVLLNFGVRDMHRGVSRLFSHLDINAAQRTAIRLHCNNSTLT